MRRCGAAGRRPRRPAPSQAGSGSRAETAACIAAQPPCKPRGGVCHHVFASLLAWSARQAPIKSLGATQMGGRQREEGTQVPVDGIDCPIRFRNSLLNAGYGRFRLAGLCQPYGGSERGCSSREPMAGRRTAARGPADDQIVPIDASARRSVELVKDATLKVYPGAPTACSPPTKTSSTPTCSTSHGPELQHRRARSPSDRPTSISFGGL